MQQFENVDKDQVLEYLDDKLVSTENWKEAGKALTLVEALLNGNSQSTVENYFQESPDNLVYLMEEGKPAVRKKATSIVELLGIDLDENGNEEEENSEDVNETNGKVNGSASNNSNNNNSNQNTQQKEENLFDFDMMSGANTYVLI